MISDEGAGGADVVGNCGGRRGANWQSLACLATGVRAVVRGVVSGKRIMVIEMSSMDSRGGSLTRLLTSSRMTPICPPATRTNTKNRLEENRSLRIAPKIHLFWDSTEKPNFRSQNAKIGGMRYCLNPHRSWELCGSSRIAK